MATRRVVSDVLDELRTVPFLADKRRRAREKRRWFRIEESGDLERYFEKPRAPVSSSCAVASWDARTRLAKMLPRSAR